MPASPRFLVAAVTLWLFCLGAASADERPSLIRLTTDGHFKQRPAWSPDGTRLCFARHHADTIWLYLIHADGSGERRLTSRRDPEYDAAWSADGQRLAFTRVKVSGTQGDLDVYTISAEGSDERPFAVSEGLTRNRRRGGRTAARLPLHRRATETRNSTWPTPMAPRSAV
jgi:dipeptidyl aminopeptidase/acylaminoacyl peptidase